VGWLYAAVLGEVALPPVAPAPLGLLLAYAISSFRTGTIANTATSNNGNINRNIPIIIVCFDNSR
jgi:hypothetical protein